MNLLMAGNLISQTKEQLSLLRNLRAVFCLNNLNKAHKLAYQQNLNLICLQIHYMKNQTISKPAHRKNQKKRKQLNWNQAESMSIQSVGDYLVLEHHFQHPLIDIQERKLCLLTEKKDTAIESSEILKQLKHAAPVSKRPRANRSIADQIIRCVIQKLKMFYYRGIQCVEIKIYHSLLKSMLDDKTKYIMLCILISKDQLDLKYLGGQIGNHLSTLKEYKETKLKQSVDYYLDAITKQKLNQYIKEINLLESLLQTLGHCKNQIFFSEIQDSILQLISYHKNVVLKRTEPEIQILQRIKINQLPFLISQLKFFGVIINNEKMNDFSNSMMDCSTLQATYKGRQIHESQVQDYNYSKQIQQYSEDIFS